jgi:hypothetical protein
MPRRLSRPCRQFRRQHAEFVDGFLSGDESRAMQDHLNTCADCATRDVWVRRSLLALQTLPQIEPSADFRERLYARLAREASEPRGKRPTGIRWGVAGVIAAASIALLFAAASRSHPVEPVRLVAVQVPMLAGRTQAQGSAQARAQKTIQEMAQVAERLPRQTAGPESESATILTRSSSRFEALPGMRSVPRAPSMIRASAVRLQLANYPGQ